MAIQDLIDSEYNYTTHMGKAFPTERVVFRGKDLHHELGNYSWMQLYLFGITGKTFSDAEIQLFNYMWVITSYPEPRVWNNRIASLGGTTRTTASLAIAASIAASDATIYGGNAFIKGIDFFIRAQSLIEQGHTLDAIIQNEIQKQGTIFSYGRAFVKGDERVPHLINYLEKHRFNSGKHVQLALAIEKILQKEKHISMNISALYSAIAADLGFSRQEYHMFMTLIFVAGMFPCYIESLEKKPGTFLPIRCDNLVYKGKQTKRVISSKE